MRFVARAGRPSVSRRTARQLADTCRRDTAEQQGSEAERAEHSVAGHGCAAIMPRLTYSTDCVRGVCHRLHSSEQPTTRQSTAATEKVTLRRLRRFRIASPLRDESIVSLAPLIAQGRRRARLRRGVVHQEDPDNVQQISLLDRLLGVINDLENANRGSLARVGVLVRQASLDGVHLRRSRREKVSTSEPGEDTSAGAALARLKRI